MIRHARLTGFVFALMAFATTTPAREAATRTNDLPPIQTVLENVLKRAAQEERNDYEFRQLHHYRHLRVREHLDAEGNVKQREVKDRVHSANPDLPPKPFIPAHLRATKRPPDPPAGREKPQPYERKDFVVDSELLARYRFTLTGREIRQERPMLVIDFVPRSGSLPTRTLKDKFLNKAAGRVWVDENEWVVAAAQLRLTAPVNVLGGIVGAVQNFRCEFVRGRTASGHWYTSNMRWWLHGQQLFTRKAIASREEKTDVRQVRFYLENTADFQ